MRLASFYLLSITLHAMVLAYPVTFNARHHAETFHVTILPVDYPALEGGAGEDAAPGRKFDSHKTTPVVRKTRVEARRPVKSSPEPQLVSTSQLNIATESPISLVSAITTSSEPEAYSLPSTNANGNSENSTSGGGGMSRGGNGNGMSTVSGSGTGTGSGSASGGSGSGTASLTQARYRDTPRPEYPDDARRQGHEGRVLLRVFVDQQGEPKTVEVSRSSGSNALDMAATKAIKRWRFHPARNGDRPVDSWVNVPVDFRLTDSKN